MTLEQDFASLKQMLLHVAPPPEAELDHLRRVAEPRAYGAGHALIEAGAMPDRCWFLAADLWFFYTTEDGREFNKGIRAARARS